MPRTRKPSRPVGRRLTVRRWRPLVRPHVRSLGGFEPGPDPLTQALGAFRRAIRAYRRLAKLAPSRYDPAVVDREAQQREEQRQWIASWEPAMEKVYGPRTPAEREARRQADLLAEQPPPLHPRTQRAVERELAGYEFWKMAGKLSLTRYQEYQQRRPHDLPSLSQVARLLEIGFDFGWIATGGDWRNPAPDPFPAPPPPDFEAGLRRAYGPRDSGAPNSRSAFDQAPNPEPETCNSKPATGTAQPATSSLKPETQNLKPETRNLEPETLSPSPPTSARRDAWSSWARQLRRRST